MTSDFGQQGQSVESQTNIDGNQFNIGQSAAGPSYVHQMPGATADFVGRKKEIKKLLAAFDGKEQGPLIVGVWGMGGVGKSELAIVLAGELKDRFRDGQIYFNLRGASAGDTTKPATATEVLSHVIRSFHPEAKLPDDVDALRARYHSVLEGKSVLLLMDNVLDAGQVAPLTRLPASCALIVTSRHRFTLAEIEDIDLDTMSSEEANELLLKICSRIGDEADAVAKLCGYLPLALRLAASALKARPMLGVAKYIEDLGEEKGRLSKLDEYKDATDEALGIQASLNISYRLLDESLSGFWRALGVFPGDFDSAAAAAVGVLSEGQDAETALGNLYAASMVQWDKPSGRFSLHDLARDYARGQLSKQERANAGLCHAAHYLIVLARANELYEEGGDSIVQGLAFFDLERGNIEAGQAWAASRRAIDKTAAGLCSDYPNAGSYSLELRLHSRDRIVWLEAALDAASRLGNPQVEGAHLGNLGNAHAALGSTRKAIEYYEQNLVIAREIGDRRAEGAALGNLGLAHADLGESRKSINFYEKDLVIARDIGDRRGEGGVLGNLGVAHKNLGKPKKAIEYYEQQLEITRQIGDRRGEASALGNLGNIHKEQDEAGQANEYYVQALAISREIGDQLGEGTALGSLGSAFARLGDHGNAIKFYEQSLGINREIGNRGGEGSALGGLGVVFAALGKWRKAVECHERHLEIAHQIGDRGGEAVASHNMADALPRVGRGDEAIAYAEKALEIFEQLESPNATNARALLDRLRKQANES